VLRLAPASGLVELQQQGAHLQGAGSGWVHADK
jgi:hypothetical protein